WSTSWCGPSPRLPCDTSCQPWDSSVWLWSSARPSRAPRVITSGVDQVRSVDDVQAHRPSGARDGPHRALDARGGEVGALVLRDLADLLGGHLADLVLVRLLGAALDLGRLLEKDRRRRRLGDEGERAVGVRGDEDRDDQVAHLRRARVELLAERHDVEAVLAE